MNALLAQTADRPFVDVGWVTGNLELLWEQTLQHLWLTAIPVAIGSLIAVVLATVAMRWPGAYGPIAEATGVLYTIPSLAMFALLWPLLGGVRGKELVAIFALTTYTLLILVRNVVTGLRSVPPDVLEAAQGMGYRPARQFFEIQLPLALPAIIAGVRIATVTVIGLVTVTALIGLGGLGALILDGFRRGPLPTEVLVGTFASVLLAAAIDYLLLRVERLLTPWSRRAAA